MGIETGISADVSSDTSLRIHVIIATCGRAETVRRMIPLLEQQTRPADGILVVATCSEDVEGLAESNPMAQIVLAQRGLCCQRNVGLALVKNQADVVVFFDDDFVPASDYLESVERIMLESPDIAGMTGELVDDGILHDPIELDDAVARLEDQHERPNHSQRRRRRSLYGCNMVIRLSTLGDLQFDERLPLYGWLEDVDLTYQLGRRGRLLSGPELTGIHLGVRGGRQPGLRLGYSQVANVLYLLRKGTIPKDHGWSQLLKNLAANLVLSIVPEPHVDRRGRLVGNLMAIGDAITGRLDPGRIVSL